MTTLDDHMGDSDDEERWCPECQKYKRVNLNDNCRECGSWT